MKIDDRACILVSCYGIHRMNNYIFNYFHQYSICFKLLMENTSLRYFIYFQNAFDRWLKFVFIWWGSISSDDNIFDWYTFDEKCVRFLSSIYAADVSLANQSIKI